ncbi:MAG: hypothetical protein KF901_31885, partial [Myxococcales bacterium]|nr:hypothetical protein [Myxococcales bacterium]
TWEVVFYPLAGAAEVWVDGANPVGITAELDESDARTLVLRVPAASTLEPGTYVWRINRGDDVVTSVTGVTLDGAPHPVTAVPSGDGRPGGAFEARFYIAS